MKKISFVLIALLFVVSTFAQSEKYTAAMQQRVAAIDTIHSVDGMKDLATAFERIADAEKNQWLPYYYAALENVSMAYTMTQGQMGMADKTDAIADKAEELLNKAEAFSKDNSEIYCVKKMIATLRLMGDPMSRYASYGPIASEALETAKKLNPENPRVYLLEGQDKLFTPEQFGGSKQEAKELFEQALKKYETFKPETAIHPNWGKSQVSYFMAQIK
jgi:hypothetical protein